MKHMLNQEIERKHSTLQTFTIVTKADRKPCLAKAEVPFACRFLKGCRIWAIAPLSWPTACAPFTVRDVLSILSRVDVESAPANHFRASVLIYK